MAYLPIARRRGWSPIEDVDSIELQEVENSISLPDLSQSTGNSNPDVGSSVLDAVFNFTNSIVGAGIVGLPYALKEAGLFVGIALLIVMTALVDFTVNLLILNSKMSGHATYQGMVRYCYGNTGLLLVSFFQFVFAYGAMCGTFSLI